MRVWWLDDGGVEDVPDEPVVAPARSGSSWPPRWMTVLVPSVLFWMGVAEVLLLRWPVLPVVALLAWELLVRAWGWLDRSLWRARGLALRAARAVTAAALLLLPGPVRNLVLSVEGLPSPRLEGAVERVVVLAASGNRLVAAVGAVLVLRLVVHAVVRVADRATERVISRGVGSPVPPPLGVARAARSVSPDEADQPPWQGARHE